jgi:hypothetical protein
MTLLHYAMTVAVACAVLGSGAAVIGHMLGLN